MFARINASIASSVSTPICSPYRPRIKPFSAGACSIKSRALLKMYRKVERSQALLRNSGEISDYCMLTKRFKGVTHEHQ